jgi:hypothetical protein
MRTLTVDVTPDRLSQVRIQLIFLHLWQNLVYGLFAQSDRLCRTTPFSQINPFSVRHSQIHTTQFSLISVGLCKHPMKLPPYTTPGLDLVTLPSPLVERSRPRRYGLYMPNSTGKILSLNLFLTPKRENPNPLFP